MAQLVAGLDGCRAGWVMVTTPLAGPGPSRVEVISHLGGVFRDLESGRLLAAAIDMPIGLPSRAMSGQGLSKQVSFTVLAGRPMACHKSKQEGLAERLASLRDVFVDVEQHVGDGRQANARDDDVLDAFVAAWTARRFASGTHLQLGGDTDERGLRIEIIA